MHPMFPLLAAAWLAGAAMPSLAADYTLGDLRIAHPYARPTPPGARTGGAYFTVRNAGKVADRLTRVVSPAARVVEIHSMTMDGTLMKMRPVAGIDIPAGGQVALGSGGYHVMLIDLTRPLAAGDKVPMALTFERAGTVDIVADVEPAGARGATAPGTGHGH
ncbi:MAG TPA: copper chaperone PCu(A)C [Casimicrobiaceae bacterium]|nr:copper chaperone PCu(A)C [Casimicrobiaceae bacterium]